MNIKALFEEFKTRIKDKNEQYEIFYTKSGASFSKEELDEMKSWGGIRFAADLDNDQFYVWDYKLLHGIASGTLGLEYDNSKPKKHVIWGEGGFDPRIRKFSYLNSFTLKALSGAAATDKDVEKNLRECWMLAGKSKSLKAHLPVLIKKLEKANMGTM